MSANSTISTIITRPKRLMREPYRRRGSCRDCYKRFHLTLAKSLLGRNEAFADDGMHSSKNVDALVSKAMKYAHQLG
jgi:hypothetical protein